VHHQDLGWWQVLPRGPQIALPRRIERCVVGSSSVRVSGNAFAGVRPAAPVSEDGEKEPMTKEGLIEEVSGALGVPRKGSEVTPGVSAANLAALPGKRVSRPIYPLDTETRFDA